MAGIRQTRYRTVLSRSQQILRGRAETKRLEKEQGDRGGKGPRKKRNASVVPFSESYRRPGGTTSEKEDSYFETVRERRGQVSRSRLLPTSMALLGERKGDGEDEQVERGRKNQKEQGVARYARHRVPIAYTATASSSPDSFHGVLRSNRRRFTFILPDLSDADDQFGEK